MIERLDAGYVPPEEDHIVQELKNGGKGSWHSEYKTVTVKEAWTETVVTKEAWTETVTVKEAWTETVVTKEAWDEKVLVKEEGWY